MSVCLPPTGRWLIMPRYTQPEPNQALMLHQLNSVFLPQPPPRIKAQEEQRTGRAADTENVVPTFNAAFQGFQQLGVANPVSW